MLRDQEFKTAFLISLSVLIFFFIYILAEIPSYFTLRHIPSTPPRQIFDYGLIPIAIVSCLVCFTVTFALLKVNRHAGISGKTFVAFCYSLLLTYFIVYKMVVVDFYHIQLGGGDWGYLAVLAGWPLYIFAHIPLFLLKQYSNIALFPSLIGIIILLTLTLTGRLIYKPFYKYKTHQIETKIVLEPVMLRILKEYAASCNCMAPTMKVGLLIENKTNFTVRLGVNNYSCQYGETFDYYVAPGPQQRVEFNCGTVWPDKFNANTDALEFVLQERDNAGVQAKQTILLKDFAQLTIEPVD